MILNENGLLEGTGSLPDNHEHNSCSSLFKLTGHRVHAGHSMPTGNPDSRTFEYRDILDFGWRF